MYITVIVSHAIPSFRTDKKMFGVPLSVNVSQTGQALPLSIQHAFQHLRENGGLEIKGLFRKAASKARVDHLKEINEAEPGMFSLVRYIVCGLCCCNKLL